LAEGRWRGESGADEMADINFDEIENFDYDAKRPAATEAAPEPALPPVDAGGDPRRIDSILRIPVTMQVVVGSATIPVSNLLKLGRGAIIPLDRRVGDPVDVMVNGRLIARGEVVVVEEDATRFGVALTEIKEPQLRGRQD
jgi:flagellar motor switch protein FliN